MGMIQDLERLELIETVNQFGFAKGSEIYWLHRFRNLPENLNKNRRQLEIEIVEILRIPKLSKSTFDKTYALYKRIEQKLMTREIKEKIELLGEGQ